jgi:hypothetical protein
MDVQDGQDGGRGRERAVKKRGECSVLKCDNEHRSGSRSGMQMPHNPALSLRGPRSRDWPILAPSGFSRVVYEDHCLNIPCAVA